MKNITLKTLLASERADRGEHDEQQVNQGPQDNEQEGKTRPAVHPSGPLGGVPYGMPVATLALVQDIYKIKKLRVAVLGAPSLGQTASSYADGRGGLKMELLAACVDAGAEKAQE